jgi:hypothetical protein
MAGIPLLEHFYNCNFSNGTTSLTASKFCTYILTCYLDLDCGSTLDLLEFFRLLSCTSNSMDLSREDLWGYRRDENIQEI